MQARLNRQESRERIVAAATDLIREHSYEELSVGAVMERAGFGRTIFYRHFDGLPELVLSLFDSVTQALMSEVQGAADPSDTRGVLEAAVDAYAEHGGLLRAVDEAARHDAEIETAYRAVVDGFTAVIAGQIEEGMAAGRIRPGNAYELARALNLMNGNYLLETLGRDPDFDRRLAVDTLMAVWGPVASAE